MSQPAHCQKVIGTSQLLRREFHADFFAREGATVLVVMFGGSGVGEAEYARRRDSMVSVFDPALDALEPSIMYAFLYVTAPFDLPFARFSTDGRARDVWNSHVENELIREIDRTHPGFRELPRYLIGYSGGAVLALSGHHESDITVGAGALGGDCLDASLRRPLHWREPITLFYNPHDPIRAASADAISDLVAHEQAEEFTCRFGGHALVDYLANGSFGGLLRRAARLAGR